MLFGVCWLVGHRAGLIFGALGVDLAACGLHLAAEGRRMQHIAENVAYGAALKATGYHTGRYGTSAGVHLAAGGLHLAAQGLQKQYMAVYATLHMAVGWLATGGPQI